MVLGYLSAVNTVVTVQAGIVTRVGLYDKKITLLMLYAKQEFNSG